MKLESTDLQMYLFPYKSNGNTFNLNILLWWTSVCAESFTITFTLLYFRSPGTKWILWWRVWHWAWNVLSVYRRRLTGVWRQPRRIRWSDLPHIHRDHPDFWESHCWSTHGSNQCSQVTMWSQALLHLLRVSLQNMFLKSMYFCVSLW